jgi:hypothetical protein
MAFINKPLCATQFGNVGYGDCVLDPQKFVGAIQVTKDFQIAEGDVGTLEAKFITATHAAIGTRIFPYHNFTALTDNTEDVTINTSDYGSKTVVRDGYYDFTYRYQKGGVMLHQQIQKNAGSGKYFLFYDDSGTLYGYKSGDVLKGVPTDIFYANPWRLPTGAEAAIYTLRFIINPRYMNLGNLGYLKVTDFNLYDIEGLQELHIELYSLVGNVAKVKLYTKISAVDMYDAYSTAFAQTTAWKAVNEDGTTVAITTAPVDAAIKGWTLTFNSTTFNASDKVFLTTAVASVLRALTPTVEGFEGSEALTVEGPQS